MLIATGIGALAIRWCARRMPSSLHSFMPASDSVCLQAFQKRVAAVPGALFFLGGLGFAEQEEDGEPFLVLGEDAASILQATSDESLAMLVGAVGRTPKLDRVPTP